MKFSPFKPDVKVKKELRQMYVSEDAHDWIKKQAADNSTRMVGIVDNLIDHTISSTAMFKHLRSVIIEIDALVPDGTAYPEHLARILDEMGEALEQEKDKENAK